MTKYFGNFKNREDVATEFRQGTGSTWHNDFVTSDTFPTEDQILFAAYDTPDYEGYATVVFEKDGKLYEVNGSHCSCYGLEDQWTPEETTKEALALRKNAGYGYGQDAIARWQELFGGGDAVNKELAE